MKIQIGFEKLCRVTPIVFMLNGHPSRSHDLLTLGAIRTTPTRTITPYLDGFIGSPCLQSDFGFRFGGNVLPNLAAKSSRLSFMPRFRAASRKCWNCSSSFVFGSVSRFAATFVIWDHPMMRRWTTCVRTYCREGRIKGLELERTHFLTGRPELAWGQSMSGPGRLSPSPEPAGGTIAILPPLGGIISVC
jgi:hypothetical protein